MKTTAAIVCVLALIWAQTFVVQARPAGRGTAKSCCCQGGSRTCSCSAPASPEPPPATAIPVFSGSQHLPPPAVLAFAAWNHPGETACAVVPSAGRAGARAGVRLYERHCALLL